MHTTVTLAMLPPSVLTYVLLLATRATTTRAAFTNDFSAYPAGAQPCLQTAAERSACSGDTAAEMNGCLCNNGGNFVLAAAGCVWAADQELIDDVYSVLLASCTDTRTALSVSQAEFIAEGKGTTTATQPAATTITTTVGGAATTVTTAAAATKGSATASAASSSSSEYDDEGGGGDYEGGLGLSAKVGIISSSIAALVMLGVVISGMVFCTKRRRAQQAKREKERPLLDARGAPCHHFSTGHSTPQPSSPTTPPPARAGGDSAGASVRYPAPVGASAWRPPAHVVYSPGAPPSELTGSEGGLGSPGAPSELTGSEGLRSPWIGGAYPTDRTVSPYQQEGTWSELPAGGAAGGTRLLPNGNLMPQRAATQQGDGTWVVSPASSYATVLVPPDPTGTMTSMHGGLPAGATGTMGTMGTMANFASPMANFASPTANFASPTTYQATRSSVSSWAHAQPMQDGPYELPGIEPTPSPVEADSIPINAVPDRLTMTIEHAPPQYERGEWNDPITDKPPMS